MSFAINCPNCDARCNAPDEAEGKRIKCKKCGEAFVVRSGGRGEDSSRKSSRSRREIDDDEDDDRPRRSRRNEDAPSRPRRNKKSSNQKKAGPIVLLLVLIGGGAILLIGGGIAAAVWLKSSKSSPVVAGGESSNAGQAAASDTTNWVEFADPESRYRVKFPNRPAVSGELQNTPIGRQNVRTARGHGTPNNMGVANMFVVSSVPLPPNTDPAQRLARELDDTSFQTNGTVSERKPLNYQGKPGRELVMNAGDGKGGKGILRLIVSNNRLYIIWAFGPLVNQDKAEIAAFLNSVRID
jgi:hypothetical protein